LFVPVDTPVTTAQRIAEVGSTLPPTAAITGWAAQAWRGCRWSDGLDADGAQLDIPVAATDRRGIRRRPGVRISEEWWPPGLSTTVGGIRLASTVAAVLFTARHERTLARSVAAVDMALHQGFVTQADLGAFLGALMRRRPGVRPLREAVSLADTNTWSPQETAFRLIWSVECGFPRPLTNVPIFDCHGNHVGTPDLFDPRRGIAGEYDGDVHFNAARRRSDLRRAERFAAVGIRVVEAVSGDWDGARRRLRAAYAAPRLSGAWTLDEPYWWTQRSRRAA
jgi:hypothetical protein